MANRQSVGSILKPPKVRAPLKEIEPVDQDPDDDTASLPKRKVSFSGMNKIKMYNTGATSLTVNQAPMFDEHLSLLSDSSNCEKTKSSGNFEKSDSQINLESTNCINTENNTPGNTRVIIEYESPHDNMEMTEVLLGKILSDTVHTIESNGLVNIDYNSDCSESNMEFTEAIKGAQIILANVESDLSSNISESSSVEDEEKSATQFNSKYSTSSHNFLGKKICNISSDSNMDFTCVNKSSIPTNVSHLNTQSSAMELTCMTGKSQNYIWSSEIENNSESVYEYNQSISMELDSSQEIEENDNFKSESVHYELAEMLKISNNSNHQNISSLFKNVENNEDIEKLSMSVVFMDIDQTSKENEFDISYLNANNSEMIVNKQANSVKPTVEVENIGCSVESVLDNYSDVININDQNDKFKTLMAPVDSSLLQETSSKYCLNKSVTTIQSFHKNTSILDQNQCLDTETPLIVEENLQKNYSRKTMGRMTPLIVHKDYNNKDVSKVIKDGMQKNYSRKSIAPISVFNESQPSDDEKLSDISANIEEQEQQKYSRKSMAPTANTSNTNQTQSSEEDELSDMSANVEEQEQQKYSRKSMAPTANTSNTNQTQSSEEDELSDMSANVEEQEHQKYSRKSMAPISNPNQTQSSEEDELSDMSANVEEQEHQKYSRKSMAPISNPNQTQSSEEDELSDMSANVEEQEQQKYSRKSMAPISNPNQTQSSEEDKFSDMSAKVEEHKQKIYPRKSIAFKCISDQKQSLGYEELSDTFKIVEGSKQKSYSRKTIGPSGIMSVLNEIPDRSMFDNSLIEESSETDLRNSTSSVTPVMINNQSIVSKNNDVQKLNISKQYEENFVPKTEKKSILLNENSDDDFNSPFRKKSKKSIIPTYTTKQPIETMSVERANNLLNGEENIPETDDCLDNFENAMDISIEVESKNHIATNISSEQSNLSSSSSLNDTAPTKKITSYSINENKKSSDPQIILNISQEIKENDIKTSNEFENNSNDRDRHSDEEIKSKSIQKKDDINKINDALNSENQSFGGNISIVANTICTEGVKNISISDDKSLIENRKRSYSERNFQPLLNSTTSKPNVYNSKKNENFPKEDFLEESPIMKIVTMENLINEESLMENDVEVNQIKEELSNEDLVFEVYSFLNKQSNEFNDQKIALEKCTNREWVFNVLDGNINFKISYSPVIDKTSPLKVEDISFTTKNVIQNEITNFGINWILSKYNPKFYKQICYSSSDVELLLQSLKKDVDFISQVMQNMYYVRDIHCVTFKDNKAQFVLHDMNSLLMVNFEVSLSNIHKLSVKDISVDCFFGFFDIKILHEIIKNMAKDCNVLMSLIEQLKENVKTPMK